MVKAKFIGDKETAEYITKVFHAAPGNVVSMPDEIWEDIKSKGEDKLFNGVKETGEEFKTQKTVYIPR